MWNKTKSLFLSRILTVSAAAVFLLLAFFIPALSEYYEEVSEPVGLIMSGVFFPLCVGLYITDMLGLYALWQLNGLLNNINKNEVFIEKNTHYLRRISWSCIFAAIAFAVIGVWRFIFFMPALLACMIGLVMRVLKNVFEKAVDIKSENDFTI